MRFQTRPSAASRFTLPSANVSDTGGPTSSFGADTWKTIVVDVPAYTPMPRVLVPAIAIVLRSAALYVCPAAVTIRPGAGDGRSSGSPSSVTTRNIDGSPG